MNFDGWSLRPLGVYLALFLVVPGLALAQQSKPKADKLQLPKTVDELIEDGDFGKRFESLENEDTVAVLRKHQRALQLELLALERRLRSVRKQLRRSDEVLSKLESRPVRDQSRGDTEADPDQVNDPDDDTRSDTDSMGLDEQTPDTKPTSDTEPIPDPDKSADTKPAQPEDPGELDPNQADADQLAGIDGISDRLAQRIVWYRKNVSTFQQPRDLLRVPGFTEDLFESVRDNFQFD